MSSGSEECRAVKVDGPFTTADVEVVHRAVVALRVCEAVSSDLVSDLIAVEGKISALVASDSGA